MLGWVMVILVGYVGVGYGYVGGVGFVTVVLVVVWVAYVEFGYTYVGVDYCYVGVGFCLCWRCLFMLELGGIVDGLGYVGDGLY